MITAIIKIFVGFGAVLLFIEGIKFSKSDQSKSLGTSSRPNHWIQYLPKVHIVSFVLLVLLAITTGIGTLPVKNSLGISIFRVLGLGLYFAGAVFAIWGARSLGEEKAMDVRIRNGQKIISSGAYSYCRHPMYLGAIMIWSGASIAMLNGFMFLAAIIYTPLFIIRARLEEKLFSQHFNKLYTNYLNEVPMIFPRSIHRPIPQSKTAILSRIKTLNEDGNSTKSDKLLEVAAGKGS